MIYECGSTTTTGRITGASVYEGDVSPYSGTVRTSSVSMLAARCAPPQEKKIFAKSVGTIALGIFIGGFIAIGAYGNENNQAAATWVVAITAIIILTIILTYEKNASDWNLNEYQVLIYKWENTWLCHKCGCSFSGKKEASTILSSSRTGNDQLTEKSSNRTTKDLMEIARKLSSEGKSYEEIAAMMHIPVKKIVLLIHLSENQYENDPAEMQGLFVLESPTDTLRENLADNQPRMNASTRADIVFRSFFARRRKASRALGLSERPTWTCPVDFLPAPGRYPPRWTFIRAKSSFVSSGISEKSMAESGKAARRLRRSVRSAGVSFFITFPFFS